MIILGSSCIRGFVFGTTLRADEITRAGVRKLVSLKTFLLYIILPLTLKLYFSAFIISDSLFN